MLYILLNIIINWYIFYQRAIL